MGPVNYTPLPIAWRERNAAPVARNQVGLEILGRTNKDGTPAIFWGDNAAECYRLAEAAGWKF